MKTNVEDEVILNQFKPRWYQAIIMDALENEGYKKILDIKPRRAGKDFTWWQLAIRQAIRKTCMGFYILQSYKQAKATIWDAIDIDGVKFIDQIPKRLIKSINQSELKITLINNSIIQLASAETISSSIVGSNPYWVVMSEFALYQNQDVYGLIRPILAANGGWVGICSTPRGKNELYKLYNASLKLNDWFVLKLGVNDTQHIPPDVLEQERAQMDPGLFAQEYECSFLRGIEQSVYGRNMDTMRAENRITHVPWDTSRPVFTAWDLGKSDTNVILWFQACQDTGVIKIIDSYGNNGFGLDHYINIVKSKPYTYESNGHYAPHDIAVSDYTLPGTITRKDKARELGLNFQVAPNISISEGIDHVRSMINKIWIDDKQTRFVDALENYRYDWDPVKEEPSKVPIHNWTSHWCFTADTQVLTRNGMRHIVEIEDYDEVLTLKGWSKCTKAQLIKKNANLVEVKFGDNTTVRCTPDHLFLTEKGWISAESLEKGTKIQSYSMKSHNTLMENSIDYMREKDTFLVGREHCIERYGKMLLEKYLRNHIYITKIAILKIIIYGTLNACQLKYTLRCPALIARDLVTRQEMLLQSGIDHPKVDYGTKDMRNELSHGQNGSAKLKSVYIAIKNSMRLLEIMDLHKNIVMPIAKPLHIESVTCLIKKEDVYCIGVPDAGHFALGNGVIVKNCDALRYLCQMVYKTRRKSTAEEFDRKRAEALYGNKTQLPRQFQWDSRYDR
jgi:phage terminase large subunit